MDFFNMKVKQQALIVSLIAVVAIIAYAKIVHEPFSRQVGSYRSKIKKYESQLLDLQTKFPPVEQQRKKIEVLKAQCEKLLAQIAEIEKKLPPKKQTSQLIGEFTRLAKEARLLSIRQKTMIKDGYNKIFIEVRLAAPYPVAIAYISRLESISPFLRVEEVDINESKGKTFEEGGAPVRVVISSILGDAPIEQAMKANEEEKTPDVKRDILASSARPMAELSEKDFRLEGITFTEDAATAIINGEVFRVNSEIKGYTVKKIMPGSVILTDGTEDHLLTLNR
jgi:Tfp pilus assembly protein PilO